MTTARDIIVNAAAEAKLCSIRQQLPAELLQTGKTLLNNRIAQYSNSNFLSFTRKAATFNYGHSNSTTAAYDGTVIGGFQLKNGYTRGENFFIYNVDELPEANSETKEIGCVAYDPNNPDIVYDVVQAGREMYAWRNTRYQNIDTALQRIACFELFPDVYAPLLNDVTRLYMKTTNSDNLQWREMSFVAYEDFDKFNEASTIYSSIPRTDEFVEILVKKPYKSNVFKAIYNARFSVFDIDEDLRVPPQWISLFTAALVVDFNRAYPRLSDSTVQICERRLDELEHNIMRSSSVNKFIGRYDDNANVNNYSIGLNGSFFF